MDFGGKCPSQQGVEAARLAKMTGKPVMVVWSRDEEFFYDAFHPAGVIKVRSGVDKAGMLNSGIIRFTIQAQGDQRQLMMFLMLLQLITVRNGELPRFILSVPVPGEPLIIIQIPLPERCRLISWLLLRVSILWNSGLRTCPINILLVV